MSCLFERHEGIDDEAKESDMEDLGPDRVVEPRKQGKQIFVKTRKAVGTTNRFWNDSKASWIG